MEGLNREDGMEQETEGTAGSGQVRRDAEPISTEQISSHVAQLLANHEPLLLGCEICAAVSPRLAELEQAERETRTERGLREDAERERDKAQDRWGQAERERGEEHEMNRKLLFEMDGENGEWLGAINKELNRALTKRNEELIAAEVRLASVPALVEALRECNEAGRGLTADLIAVKPHLDLRYPDDPRWTPWTRFVERGLGRLDEARKKARAALAAHEQAGTDA